MAAKKNTGMNAIIAMPKMTFSTVNAWLLKIRTLISGDSVRRSTAKNTIRRIMPAAMLTQMTGLPQPHSADCWNPNTDSPTPPAIRTRPR